MITEKTCNMGYNGFLQYFRFVTKLCDKYLINHFAKDANSSPKYGKRERQGFASMSDALGLFVQYLQATCFLRPVALFISF